MPSQILHTMFGEDAIAGTASLKIPQEHRGFFALGCQGPDIFYHSQRSRPVALEYGSLLHRRNYGVFCASLLEGSLRENGAGSALNCYALGFITHAALDRFCHPYIIYRAGKTYHSFFERIIDTLMLEKLRGLTPARWDRERELASVCEDPPPGLKKLIGISLAKTFPEKTCKDRSLSRRIDNTFTDTARFYNMSSPSKIKAASSAVFTRRAINYMYPQDLSPEIDFLNLNRGAWRYPYIPPRGKSPEDDYRSFPDIYRDALKAAVEILALCEKTPADDLAEKTGNGSLSINDEEGNPCPPNLTDLLPLQEVFEQQAKLRGIN